MFQFGEALRRERQSRSVSLEDISKTTKVAVRNLKALESNAFDQLPGGILSKGIVRGYVRCLGLNENEWVSRFLDASGQSSDPAFLPPRDLMAFALNVSNSRTGNISNSRIGKIPGISNLNSELGLRWAGVVLLLLLLCGLGWFAWVFVHAHAVSTAQDRGAVHVLNSQPYHSLPESAGR